MKRIKTTGKEERGEDKVLRELRIGNVLLKNNIILAPMAGVTDLPFRLLCARQGAGLVCTEMVSAKAILYRNKNTERLMEICPEEGTVSLQLFGSDPDVVSEAARRIEERPFAVLDINMGCPVPKVVNNGEGSALMRNPALAGRIIEKTVRAVNKPVTVKIRKGFEETDNSAAELAHIAQESGASAVTVHGRTREQYYSGKADWDVIREVKETVRIPVIGNGDVTDGPSAEELMAETGCDGIMVGRAARGNPWLFHRICTYLEKGIVEERPSAEEIKEMILEHTGLQLACKGEYTGIREMRKHVSWYTAGYPHSARLRGRINEAESLAELEEIVKGL